MSRRARRCWRISRAIHRPRNSSPPNSRVTSWPTIRRRPWWRGSPTSSREPTATSRRWRRRWWIPMRPGRRRSTKMRSPYEFLVATGRLLAQIPKIPAAISAASTCWASRYGRRRGRTVSPIATRHGRRRRASSCGSIFRRRSPHGSPTASIRATCSNSLPRMRRHQETRRTIERAELRQQALALLLMSPEFQRR